MFECLLLRSINDFSFQKFMLQLNLSMSKDFDITTISIERLRGKSSQKIRDNFTFI